MSAQNQTTKHMKTPTRNMINWKAIFRLNKPQIGAEYIMPIEIAELCASRLNQLGWKTKRVTSEDGTKTIRVVGKTEPRSTHDQLMSRLRMLEVKHLRSLVKTCEQVGYL